MIEEALNALPNEELDHAKTYADKLQLTIRDESVRMKKEKSDRSYINVDIKMM